MSTREKQTILNIIIIISLLAIVVILAYIIYPETVKKQVNENINYQTENTTINNTENTSKTTQQTENTQQTQTTKTESTDTTGSVGSEEVNSQNEDETKSKEERALDLAKKEWGESDTSVTYSIEQKDGDIYYISVKKDTVVQLWYEVDTNNWTISQY